MLDDARPVPREPEPGRQLAQLLQDDVTDFLSNPPVGLSGTLTPQPGQPAARHALRQLGYITAGVAGDLSEPPRPRTAATATSSRSTRSSSRAGAARNGIFPSFDCDNSGGERVAGDGKSPAVGIGPPQFAPCFLQSDFADEFGGGRGPQVSADGNP